jgi:hypothetical protein
MIRRSLFVAFALALVACPAAAGHGDGATRGYRSTVTRINPAVTGLTAEVLDGDDRLWVRNETGREVVIKGYEGEPYLRFEAGGDVLRNENSPARYLNEERYGGVDVPASASKRASPRWQRVAGDGTYDWHDHRIHWMSAIDPPTVRRSPERAQHVYDWMVPASIGGTPLAVHGSLDYRPPPKSSFDRVLLLPLVALGLAVIGLWGLRRHRSRAVS